MPERDANRRAAFRDSIPAGIVGSVALWLVLELVISWLADAAPGVMLSLGLLALSAVAILVAAAFYTFRN